MCAFKLYFGHVTGWQCANLVNHVHEYLRAVSGQALPGNGIFCQYFFLLGGFFQEACWVFNIANPFGATHDNGFQVFGGHHSTNTGTASRSVQIVNHPRIQTALFGRTTHSSDANLRLRVTFTQLFVSRPNRHAPNTIGGHQFCCIIFKMQVNGVSRFTLENNHIPSGVFDFSADKAT